MIEVIQKDRKIETGWAATFPCLGIVTDGKIHGIGFNNLDEMKKARDFLNEAIVEVETSGDDSGVPISGIKTAGL